MDILEHFHLPGIFLVLFTHLQVSKWSKHRPFLLLIQYHYQYGPTATYTASYHIVYFSNSVFLLEFGPSIFHEVQLADAGFKNTGFDSNMIPPPLNFSNSVSTTTIFGIFLAPFTRVQGLGKGLEVSTRYSSMTATTIYEPMDPTSRLILDTYLAFKIPVAKGSTHNPPPSCTKLWLIKNP